MEALIIVLIESLAALLGPLIEFALVLIVSLAVLVPELLVYLGLWLRDCRRRKWVPVTDVVSPLRTSTRRWVRLLFIGCSSLSVICLVGVIIVNQWFLNDLARALLNRQQQRTGIAITAQRIEGNLFSGRFTASGITVKREGEALIDLNVRQMEVVIPFLRAFTNPIALSEVTLDGVTGRYERGVGTQPGMAPAVPWLNLKPKRSGFSFQPGFNSKRDFSINVFTITNLNIAYADHTRALPLAAVVTLDHLNIPALRSRWAVFDLLFRSQATGSIAGRPFQITTSGDGLKRSTQWKIEEMPVGLLASQISGPFLMLHEGACNVLVDCHWRESKGERLVDMDWYIDLKGVTTALPDFVDSTYAELFAPAMAYIKAKAGTLPLRFTLELEEKRFDGALSAEAAGTWKIVGDSLAASFGREFGLDPDLVKKIGRGLLDFTNYEMQHWRKR
jgi:hypothetical protein